MLDFYPVWVYLEGAIHGSLMVLQHLLLLSMHFRNFFRSKIFLCLGSMTAVLVETPTLSFDLNKPQHSIIQQFV